MLAIYKKELHTFFGSPIGYLIVGLFLTLNSLFLWVFKNDYNVFDYGFADLSKFFFLTPWVFLFMIPAITMKSFSDENKMGTLELLLIKPIGLWRIVQGKFWGAFSVTLIALIPTLIYVFSISQLGTTLGNYDLGMVIGSYFGLIFLVFVFTAIALFASSISSNQILAFILGGLLCFLFYYGFEAVASLFNSGEIKDFVSSMGARAHFKTIASGLIDSRDLVYFASIGLFFLLMTQLRLKHLSK
ncbi:MAG: gliding motility-associated ABC transporter permease subunit GldF [Croceitalea sp.]|nr:gliding motility-associated ABC transporter permease subunit GldF [Croceitalea sp.]